MEYFFAFSLEFIVLFDFPEKEIFRQVLKLSNADVRHNFACGVSLGLMYHLHLYTTFLCVRMYIFKSLDCAGGMKVGQLLLFPAASMKNWDLLC